MRMGRMSHIESMILQSAHKCPEGRSRSRRNVRTISLPWKFLTDLETTHLLVNWEGDASLTSPSSPPPHSSLLTPHSPTLSLNLLPSLLTLPLTPHSPLLLSVLAPSLCHLCPGVTSCPPHSPPFSSANYKLRSREQEQGQEWFLHFLIHVHYDMKVSHIFRSSNKKRRKIEI